MTVAVTVALLVGLGLVAGAGLALADRYFGVEEDPRVEILEEALPGANCGACGYPGCRAYAKALVQGEDITLCAPGGNSTVRKVAAILGQEAVEVVEKVALVKCAGTLSVTTLKARYEGIHDCVAANIVAAGTTACPDGCLGLGSCVEACDYDAIVIRDGVAVVLPELCIGDGKCVPACPRGLIELVPKTQKVHVLCSNHLPAREVRKVCQVGCTGCKLCTRVDPAFVVEDNVARVVGEPSEKASEAALACPTQSILDLTLFTAEEFVSSAAARQRLKELQADYKERKKRERLAAKKKAGSKPGGGPAKAGERGTKQEPDGSETGQGEGKGARAATASEAGKGKSGQGEAKAGESGRRSEAGQGTSPQGEAKASGHGVKAGQGEAKAGEGAETSGGPGRGTGGSQPAAGGSESEPGDRE